MAHMHHMIHSWDCASTISWQLMCIHPTWMEFQFYKLDTHQLSRNCWCAISRVMSHMWMSHIIHANESCLTCEWVMSHKWIRHVIHVNESCLTGECVMFHMWMGRVIHVNESCLTRDWVMFHKWMSHVSHVNESCFTCEWVMSHTWMIRVELMNDLRLTCEWVMAHMHDDGWRKQIKSHELVGILPHRLTCE